MSVSRELLARYLRQLGELGIHDVVLDDMTAGEALRLLGRKPAGQAASGRTRRPAEPAAAPLPAAPAATSRATTAPTPATASVAAAGARAAAAAPAAPAADTPATTPAETPATAAVGRPDLTVLGAVAAGCTLCRLHESRTNVVFGEGNARAEVVVVGEAPGQEEDRSGRPFVGRAGRLLDLLLLTAGFPRESVYICNVLKCRPPENRNPLPDEVAACTTSYLHGQLEAIGPRVLLAVGKFAAQALLSSEESIGRLRGGVHSYRGTPLVVTYHPAYLLRSPQMTRVAWQDFQLVRKVLHEQARG